MIVKTVVFVIIDKVTLFALMIMCDIMTVVFADSIFKIAVCLGVFWFLVGISVLNGFCLLLLLLFG